MAAELMAVVKTEDGDRVPTGDLMGLLSVRLEGAETTWSGALPAFRRSARKRDLFAGLALPASRRLRHTVGIKRTASSLSRRSRVLPFTHARPLHRRRAPLHFPTLSRRHAV